MDFYEGAVRKSLQAHAASLDPGGLFYTSEDEQIAAGQAKVDIGGYGAKSTLATREVQKKAEQENLIAAQAAGQERRLVEAQQGIEAEKKRRLDERRRRQIERGSLMYGMETGMGDTLG